MHNKTRQQVMLNYQWGKTYQRKLEQLGMPKVGRHRAARFDFSEIDSWLKSREPRSLASGLKAAFERYERAA